MGGHFSRRRRRQNRHRAYDPDHHDQNQPQSFPSTTTTPSNQLTSSSLNTGADNANPVSLMNTTTILPPPPPPPSYAFAARAPYLPLPSPPPSLSPFSYNSPTYSMPMNSRWAPHRSTIPGPPVPMPAPPPPPPPPYVDHNHAKKIKNDINVHKDSIRLVIDEKILDSHLVSFTFDALVDGSITVYYFAKEEMNCKFMPLYPEIYTPKKIPFEKGLGQKFCQPLGTGIDLGFFELHQLSKPSPDEDIFPLVIYAETCIPSQPQATMSPQAQITQAILDRNSEGHFLVKVVKQILWIDGARYELRDIYGLDNSNASDFDEKETGKECVICMTEPKDTVVLPCRHMCLCSECAKELRLQSDKCPICRQPICELVEIKPEKDSDPQ